ncbi:hypothetical protein ACFSKW_50355 [Nonomuraea mangrovi]|uniref:Uncharacterized protein n=1 Tax=Nonomuraea mangrovi TaxID=2316207 RepID=A0ABW4TEA2_9ACTN
MAVRSAPLADLVYVADVQAAVEAELASRRDHAEQVGPIYPPHDSQRGGTGPAVLRSIHDAGVVDKDVGPAALLLDSLRRPHTGGIGDVKPDVRLTDSRGGGSLASLLVARAHNGGDASFAEQPLLEPMPLLAPVMRAVVVMGTSLPVLSFLRTS